MIYPDETEYLKLAGQYDLVPVYEEFLADSETPLSVLARFSDRENVFLLESMEGGERWGRYSFIGVDATPFLEVDHSGGRTGRLDMLRRIYKDVRVAPVPGVPRFFGGAVGFLAYEAVGEFERMPLPKRIPGRAAPSSRFVHADRVIAFDNIRHTAKVVVCTRPTAARSPQEVYQSAKAAIQSIRDTIGRPTPAEPVARHPRVVLRSNMTEAAFCDIVRRAKEYIGAGDVIQVVLSQRFGAESRIPPLHLYRALRFLNPSPYTFFLKMGRQTLVGSSPEVMVRLTGSAVEVRPIAGTRPRGETEQRDRELADELLSSDKEKAEHVMLVDLGRNDIGRVAESGSVQVREYMVIERYSHVMHLVSHVEGILRKGFDAFDVLAATFPAGTLSGAPKIRAMEIVHELEPEPRGAYGGAVGYISYNGNMDFAITIRTLEVAPDRLAIQAGAGIVFDSDPRQEFLETCHKARALRRAVDLAANGLDLDAPIPGGGEDGP